MPDWVCTQQEGELFEIILNRPEKRNAINWPMMQSLAEAIAQAEQAPGVRTVLVRGEGPVFSAGIDLTAFTELSERYGSGWQASMPAITAEFQAVFNRFELSKLPIIALLHGHALGMGLELALACDFRLAAAGTMLGLPEARLGLIPDVGGTTRLVRLLGTGRAKELVMTGRMIEAQQAGEWGLVNAVVSAAGLSARGRELAGELAQAAPLAVALAKRVIDGTGYLAQGLSLEAWAQSQLIQTQDFQAGVQAMLERRNPVWKGK